MLRFASVHPVDNAAEEDRLGKLRRGEREIGKGEKDRHMCLCAEEAECAEIKPRQRKVLGVVPGLGHALEINRRGAATRAFFDIVQMRSCPSGEANSN